MGDWIGSSPAVAGGCVFVGSNDNIFYCLNATSGLQTLELYYGGLRLVITRGERRARLLWQRRWVDVLLDGFYTLTPILNLNHAQSKFQRHYKNIMERCHGANTYKLYTIYQHDYEHRWFSKFNHYHGIHIVYRSDCFQRHVLLCCDCSEC